MDDYKKGNDGLNYIFEYTKKNERPYKVVTYQLLTDCPPNGEEAQSPVQNVTTKPAGMAAQYYEFQGTVGCGTPQNVRLSMNVHHSARLGSCEHIKFIFL